MLERATVCSRFSICLKNLLSDALGHLFVWPYPTVSFRKREPDGSWTEQPVRFPERKLKTVRYDLEAAYAGIYDEVVSGIESLSLAPYNLEDYKKAGVAETNSKRAAKRLWSAFSKVVI